MKLRDTKGEIMLYEILNRWVAGDTLEIFGNSGSGKSTFAIEAAKEFIAKGKKVLYIDTEKNIVDIPDKMDYKYVPDFDDAAAVIIKPELKEEESIASGIQIPKGYKLICLDSLGLPILGKFALLNLRDRGNILLKCEALSAALKIYCQKNNAIAIVTNQPQSEMGKGAFETLLPFGEKSIYFYKEVWKTVVKSNSPDETVCAIEAFRSRLTGRKTELMRMYINKDGVTIKPTFDMLPTKKETVKEEVKQDEGK